MPVNYTERQTTWKHFHNCVSGVFKDCLSFSSVEVCLKTAYIMAGNLSLNSLNVYAMKFSCVLMVFTESC